MHFTPFFYYSSHVRFLLAPFTETYPCVYISVFKKTNRFFPNIIQIFPGCLKIMDIMVNYNKEYYFQERGKNMRKSLMVLFALILLVSSGITILAEENPEIQTQAWPGRPGGNGDGSEEWLSGSYGQTNGAYKLLFTHKGSASKLNNSKAVADTIGLGIVSALAGNILVGTKVLVSNGIITAAGVGAVLSGGYEGAYYISKTYISGRCMKTVITTYKKSNYTGVVKTYTRYKKW